MNIRSFFFLSPSHSLSTHLQITASKPAHIFTPNWWRKNTLSLTNKQHHRNRIFKAWFQYIPMISTLNALLLFFCYASCWCCCCWCHQSQFCSSFSRCFDDNFGREKALSNIKEGKGIPHRYFLNTSRASRKFALLMEQAVREMREDHSIGDSCRCFEKKNLNIMIN